jgi:hypothetical protein
MATTDIPSAKREFRCNHCNGKILIPQDLPPTTGPCPHCSGIITSPAPESAAPAPFPVRPLEVQVPVPQVPVRAGTPPQPIPSKAQPETPVPQPPPPAARPAIPPVRESQIPPAVMPAAPVPAVPAKTELPKRNVEIPHASDPSHGNKRKPKPAKAAEPVGPSAKSRLIPVMLVILLLFAGIGTAVYFIADELGRKVDAPDISGFAPDPQAAEANYLRTGWQKEAYQILGDFIAADSASGKLPFILKSAELEPKLREFYGDKPINDADTPAEAFSVYELPEEDRKRGLFMMTYDQPPQYEMKEFFRPLATLEVQYDIEEADLLLSSLAKAGNFTTEPLRVHAFFKRTPEGLKLDWEVFLQTKYRTFETFVKVPEIGNTAVFRVLIVEDVPEKGRPETGTRTYRVVDPANIDDSARINVKFDSETGRALSVINWRGGKENQPITRTATVELKWTGDPGAPELEISRFICWEFLGLGGQETPATASTK